jgi:hypothetical protein
MRRRTMHMVMHDREIATGRHMTDHVPEPPPATASADDLRALAAAAGVSLSAERAAALVSQAAPHFALLRALDGAVERAVEPAAEFHLDCWRRPDDG